MTLIDNEARHHSRGRGRRPDAKHQKIPQLPFAQPQLTLEPSRIISDDQVETIHQRSLDVLEEIGTSVGNWWHFALHAVQNPVFYLMAAGVFTAWAVYIRWPHIPGVIDSKLTLLRKLLENKYFFDWFNENVIARGSVLLGKGFWKVGDQGIIDGVAVNGSANTIGFIAGIVRRVQSGFLYSYAFWMVIGLALMLGWFLTRLI